VATRRADRSSCIRTVDRCIAEMRTSGLLEVRTGGGRHRSNTYFGLIPEKLWSIWPEEFVDRMVTLGVLGQDGDVNDDTDYADYRETMQRARQTVQPVLRTLQRPARNGAISYCTRS
jgi:hypothetical protein